MFDRTSKVSRVTWKTILMNPLILGSMVLPSDGKSAYLLLATAVILAGSGLMPLSIPRIPVSVSIACGIIFVLGCSVGGLGLVKILERQFPNFPVVIQWEWEQSLPSAFESLAILVWIYVVLNISPVTRALFIGAVFVAAASGHTLTSDVLAIREVLVFDVIRETTGWEQGAEALLSGCALVAWARLVISEFASTSIERVTGRCTLFVGGISILEGIFRILWDIFS